MAEREELCPMTVYFPKSIMDEIIRRKSIFRRSKNEEVLFLIDIGLAEEAERSKALLSLLTSFPLNKTE